MSNKFSFFFSSITDCSFELEKNCMAEKEKKINLLNTKYSVFECYVPNGIALSRRWKEKKSLDVIEFALAQINTKQQDLFKV